MLIADSLIVTGSMEISDVQSYSAMLLQTCAHCAAEMTAPLVTHWLLQASGQDSAEASSAETNDVQPLVRDADSVLSCLKRALKIANAAQQQLAVALKAADTAPAFLYVDILNQYLYYFDQGLPNITSSVMQVSQPH